jgi:hypothetical protein
MWHHVTNHLIISNDKYVNSENRIKLRVRDRERQPTASVKEARQVPAGKSLTIFPSLSNLLNVISKTSWKLQALISACKWLQLPQLAQSGQEL